VITLTIAVIVATILSGALVGLLLAVFGGGGSVLAAPLLLYAVGVRDPHIAIGTSSAAVAANAAFNLMGHWRGGRVKWPCAATFAAAGLAGSFAGSTLAKAMSGAHLLLAFAIAMAAIALSMLSRPKSEGDPDVHVTAKLMLRLAPLGLLTGFAAGFFGIGGGFLIVPGLMLATGMTMANATASSLVSVTIFGAATPGSCCSAARWAALLAWRSPRSSRRARYLLVAGSPAWCWSWPRMSPGARWPRFSRRVHNITPPPELP
jgi:uncharacterized membrane protein YfcA